MTDVEVVDVPEEIFILGVDWIGKEKANINLEDEVLEITQRGRTYTVPVKYIKEDYDEEEYEEESLC
jgi:hypothetical protein